MITEKCSLAFAIINLIIAINNVNCTIELDINSNIYGNNDDNYKFNSKNSNNYYNKSIGDGDYRCDQDDIGGGSSSSATWEPEEPLVITKWSTIKGFTRKLKGIKVAHFLGIPYAQPPVGKLRFQKPKPLQPLETNTYADNNNNESKERKVYEAFKFGTACMQKSSLILNLSKVPVSEDCLYINVYTPLDSLQSFPSSSTGQVKPLLPVSVHIHGSAFVYLSSADPLFYGGYLSALANVVVVTFNYRLGLFGLMYGHDTHIPGNLALYDQRAALIWVRQNIESFGGDPGQITLSGHSSGASFVALHLFSTQSRYLFKNAAVLSGTATRRSATDSRSTALAKTRKLVSLLGCSDPHESRNDTGSYDSGYQHSYEYNSNIDQLSQYEVDCLMSKDAFDLVEAQPDVSKEIWVYDEMCSIDIFLPFYGNPLLPESPDSMLSKGNFRRDISILIGRVPIESARGITQIDWDVNEVRDRMRNDLQAALKDNSTENIERVLEYYFHDCKTGDIRPIAEAVLNIFNDVCWHCPNLMLASQWSKYNRVYLYSYTYKSNHLGDLDLLQLLGAYHTEDVSLIFGYPHQYCGHYSDADRAVSSHMINLWSNFLYTGSGDWSTIVRHHGAVLPFHQQITGIWNQKRDKLDDKQYICQLLNY